MRGVGLLVLLVGCAAASNAAPPGPSAPPVLDGTQAAKVGDRMAPITSPIAIPARGAKLTMVSYFATWCEASKRWIPHVEAMKQKYAASGVVVVGVANVDESPQAGLEEFIKTYGGTYPVVTDNDRRIGNALPPNGWGQAIIVVDAKGIVRLVHRGTQEGAFEKVDAELGRLLAP